MSAALAGVDLPDLRGIGATLDHVALAARRIRDLLPLWQDLMGGEFLMGADNPGIGWRAVRLTYQGSPYIELIEPLAGSTFFDGFFRRRPLGGVHHVTFHVDDAQLAQEQLSALGLSPFGLNLANPAWQEVFVHPRDGFGVLLQFVASAPGTGGPPPGLTLETMLAGDGPGGTGIPSP